MTVPVMKYCGGYINIIRYSKNSAGNAIYSLSENISANHTWGKLLAVSCICKMCVKCCQPTFNTAIKQRAVFSQFCFQLQRHTLKVSVLSGESTATRAEFITPVMREYSLESVLKPHKKQVRALKFMYITHKITIIFCRGFHAKISQTALSESDFSGFSLQCAE